MAIRWGDGWGAPLAVGVLCLGASSVAAGQTPERASGLTPPHAIEIEGTVALFHRELEPSPFPGVPSDPGAINGVSGGIGASARLRAFTREVAADASVLLDVDLGWRFWAGQFYRPDGSLVCCRLLNPYVGASLGWENHDVRARFGAGVTLPLTTAFEYDGAAEQHLWFQADAGMGYRDGWMAMGETMAVVVRTDWEARIGVFRVGVEGALALMVPVLRDGRPSDPSIAPFTRYQFVVSAAAVIDPWVELGVRVGLAGWAGIDQRFPTFVGTPEPNRFPIERIVDEAQISAIPFARLRFSPGYLEARAIVFIDDPSGLVSETTHLTFSLAGGLELD
jgi:hypothetical protein